MANILLSDEEYQAVEALHTDALNKITEASPRLAGLYRRLEKTYADFLNKEDGKRALRAKKQERQAAADQMAQKRRAAALQAAQQKLTEKSGPAPATSGATQSTRSKAS